MPHTMTRARANAIRAVGLSAGALLVVAAGAVAFTAGADPASIGPGEVKVPDLAPQQQRREIYPDEIATWISTAYRHDFADETPKEPTTGPVQPTAPRGATVRLVGVIGAGARSMAIVGLDGEQLLLAAGESGPDFRIEEIHEDHIVMVRDGQRSEVRLGERQGPLAGDIRPGGFGAGGGAVAGSPGGVYGQGGRGGADGGRSERDRSLEARRREAEERRAAARAIEAAGGGNEDDGPPSVMGNGNSLGRAVGGADAAGGADGANGMNGANGAAEGQMLRPGDAQRTRGRQSGGRPAGGNGDSNN